MAGPSELSQKRLILMAITDEKLRLFLSKEIKRHIKNTQFYHAADGSEAINKIKNAPPFIVILTRNLAKSDGFSVIDSILSNPSLKRVAIIMLCPVPKAHRFVDEVVLGRVQFLGDWDDSYAVSKALARALNYQFRGAPKDFQLKFLSPGEVLIREGEKGSSVYIVQHGELEASVDGEDDRIVLGKISIGEFVGEMAYINHEPRSADVIAVTDCELIEIPVDLLDQVLFQRPAWSKALIQTLSKRVKATNKRIKSKSL